ncbi:MAG: helix-turn-helix domain-containing protein, partial [Lactococcus lactis]|nr:helix-turn-helix domain-containing protein [Lactococcus lactis]
MAKNRIKELRNSANPKITLKELSEKLKEKGLSFTDSQLSKFENGMSTPRNEEIWGALAEIFDTSAYYVMGYDIDEKELTDLF